MTVHLDDVIKVLTALTLAGALIEALRRWAVKWLKVHVVGPLLETRDQVKTNGHVSNPPTLLDTVHTVKDEVGQARGELVDAKDAFHLAALMFEGHIEASEADRAALWAAVRALERTGAQAATLPALLTRLEAVLETHTTERNSPS